MDKEANKQKKNTKDPNVHYNRLYQIRMHQESLEKDRKKNLKKIENQKKFPPIGLEIITKIIYNQNATILDNFKNKNQYLKFSYCVPDLTTNPHLEDLQI